MRMSSTNNVSRGSKKRGFKVGNKKTDAIMCTIKKSYAVKYMLIYVNCLTISFGNKKNN